MSLAALFLSAALAQKPLMEQAERAQHAERAEKAPSVTGGSPRCSFCAAMDANARTVRDLLGSGERDKAAQVAAKMLAVRLREDATKPLSSSEIASVLRYLDTAGDADGQGRVLTEFRSFARTAGPRLAEPLKFFPGSRRAELEALLQGR